MPMGADSQTWLMEQLTEHFSVDATVVRGANSFTLAVIPSQPDSQRVEAGRARVKIDAEWVDFKFQPSLYVFDAIDGVVDPEVGDRFTIGTLVREVIGMDGRPPVERTAFGASITVHTMLVRIL